MVLGPGKPDTPQKIIIIKKIGVRSDLYHQSSNEDPPNKRIKRYM